MIFSRISQEADLEWLFIDGSIVRAHQHSTGAATPNAEAIGKSRGGNNTKIPLAVDSYGLPVHFELTGGQVHDVACAEQLIIGAPPSEYTIGDKSYDSEPLREKLRARGSVLVIPRRKTTAWEIKAWTGVWLNTVIWLKTRLLELSISVR